MIFEGFYEILEGFWTSTALITTYNAANPNEYMLVRVLLMFDITTRPDLSLLHILGVPYNCQSS